MRINNSFSSLHEKVDGVPQGSILGPIFFNIHRRDLFHLTETREIVNYANERNPYTAGRTFLDITNSLEK